MNIWLDLGIAALIILFGYSGFKRGLIYMVLNAVGTVVALVASAFLSSMFSLLVYNLVFKQNILNGLTEATKQITTSDPALMAQQTLDSVSNFSLNVFSFLGLDSKALSDTLQKSVLGIPETVEEIIRPFAVKMISCVLTIVFFLILMIVVSFLVKKFSAMFNRIKIVGIPNQIFGAVVGIVQGIFVSMLMTLILYFVMMFISPTHCEALRESINNTIFYSFITKISLPELIINWLSSL